MRIFRWALVAVLLVVLAVAVQQTLLWLGFWGAVGDSQVKALHDADQEIALIEPATSFDDWGRIVTAVQLVQKDWQKLNPKLPALHIALDDAFPLLTTDVPEIVFSFANHPNQKLRLRWYKITGEHDPNSWIQKLNERARPPLAIIGGGTSDRAVRLARALQRTYADPAQASPVLLITTATAEKTAKDEPLIEIYAQRSFRFSFTNQKMVEALLEFAQHREFPEKAKKWGAGNLWVHNPAEPQAPVSAVSMHAISWQDERYSTDMVSLFEEEFKKRYTQDKFVNQGSIPGGPGGFFQAAPQEQFLIQTFLNGDTPIAPNSFLALPTQTVRMRRFLINLRQRSQKDARNLVVLNGDGLAFHSIFRDRDVMWSVLDLPYSLVFFSHRTPIDRGAGFPKIEEDGRAVWPEGAGQRTTSGTHDILLYRDVFEAFLYAAFDEGSLLSDPAVVRDRLKTTCWYFPADERKMSDDPPRVCNSQVHALDLEQRRFFSGAGNRRSRTGEHIVWLKPSFTDDRVDLQSTISVWTTRPDPKKAVWNLVDAFPAYYNQARLEGGQ